MTVLNGRQAELSLRIDGVFYPLLCAMSCSFQYDHEEVLLTSRNSGKWRERKTRICDWGFSLTGLTKVDNTDGQVSFFYLLTEAVRGTSQYMRLKFTDADGNVKNIYGYVLIKQGQIEAAISGFSTASQFFPGTGAFSTDAVAGYSPDDLFKLYLDTTPGAYEVSHADLGGATEIMLVEREDAFYKEVTGTPVGRRVKFTDNTTSGTLTFDSTLPFNPGEIVYVGFKKPI